ncbi:MAG: TatD family hydrolase [Clostridium sp.]|nr:TatD family hydrolase [Clostridium sp.]
MIDTHSHLYVEEFHEDIDAVLSRAREAGVTKIFLPCINESSLQEMQNLCARIPGYLYPMIGLHPTDVMPDYREVLTRMEKLLRTDHPFIGVGEVGLDFYWDKTYCREQTDAFVRQIEWAAAYKIPLMIHVREAHEELVRVMDAYRNENLTGVFHCFSGTEEEARHLLSYDGFMLGINGVVTFKKSKLPEVLRRVPLNRIVLETDSPYLAPVPFRGKRNESAFVVHVACVLSQIYQIPLAELVEQTDQNALRVFTRAK